MPDYYRSREKLTIPNKPGIEAALTFRHSVLGLLHIHIGWRFAYKDLHTMRCANDEPAVISGEGILLGHRGYVVARIHKLTDDEIILAACDRMGNVPPLKLSRLWLDGKELPLVAAA